MEVELPRHFYLIFTISLGYPHFKVEGTEHDRGQVNLHKVTHPRSSRTSIWTWHQIHMNVAENTQGLFLEQKATQ